MRNRKRQYSPLLGGIRTGAAKTTEGYETRDEFYAREKRAEEARQEQERRAQLAKDPVYIAQQEFNQNLRELSEKCRKFYSLPISQLQEFTNSAAPADYLENYPELVGERDGDAERALANQFFDQLKERGIELSESGWIRVWKYLTAQKVHRNIALTLDTMQRALERLNFLGVFGPEEIVKGEIPKPAYAQRQAQPQADTQPAVDPLDQLSLESREGREKALSIIGSQFDREFQAMFYEFALHLKERWNVANPYSDAIKKFAGEWFTKWNKNFRKPRDWDSFRVAAARAGLLGPGDYRRFLLPDEVHAEMIENADLSSHEARQDLARNLRLIHG